MDSIVINSHIDMDFSERTDWYDISKYCYLTENFIRENKGKLYWKYIVKYQPLSEIFMDEMQDFIDFTLVPAYQSISEDFIERHSFNINWKAVSEFQTLSEEFIQRHDKDVFWDEISKKQRLSEEFIELNRDRINWLNVSLYQNISDAFIERNRENIFSEAILFNPKNRDIESNRNKIINSRLYTCYDDYFIAYKAIRLDMYSFYNFKFRYEFGNEYESICDCSPMANSFGIHVGTRGEAIEYGHMNYRFLLIKCKVRYEDVGRVSDDCKRIRCFKIKVLN